MTTMEACGDSPRVILGSPVAGIAEDEVIDGTPAIDEIKRRYVGDPEFSNLPRKFKTADLRPAGRGARGARRRVRRRATIPSTGPASTCGSAAACPPTR